MVAQANALGNSPEEITALKVHTRHAVEPGVNFFLQKFYVQFYYVAQAFKGARYFCPRKVQELRPQPAELESLCLFTLLDNNEVIADLQAELPTYLAEAEGVRIEYCQQFKRWQDHQDQLPHSGSRTANFLACRCSAV